MKWVYLQNNIFLNLETVKKLDIKVYKAGRTTEWQVYAYFIDGTLDQIFSAKTWAECNDFCHELIK